MRKLRFLTLLVTCTAVTTSVGFNGAASAQIIEPECQGRNNHAIYDLEIYNPVNQSSIEHEDAALSGSGVICGTVVEPGFWSCGDTTPPTMNNRVVIKTPPGDSFNNTSAMSVGNFVGRARVNIAVCAASISGLSDIYTVDPVKLTVDRPSISECPESSVACYRASGNVNAGGSSIPGRGWIWITESGGRYTLTLGPFGPVEPQEGVSAGLTRIHNFTLCRTVGTASDTTCINSPSRPWIHNNGDQSTDPPPSCTNGPPPPTGPNGLYRAIAINNSGNQSSEATDCLEWDPGNRPPECNNMPPPPLNVQSGEAIRFSLRCTDPEGDTMLFDKGSASHGQVNWVNQATGEVEYTNSDDGATSDSFTFKAKDPPGSDSWSNTATATITVGPRPPQPPICPSDINKTVQQGGSVTIDIECTDPDNGPSQLTFLLVGDGPSSGSLTPPLPTTQSSVTYQHDGSATTSDSFQYKANDGLLDSSPATTVHITVTDQPNIPPVCYDTYPTFNRGSYFIYFNMPCTDPDGVGPVEEQLDFIIDDISGVEDWQTQPYDFNSNTGWLTFQPPPLYAGSFAVVYHACDIVGECSDIRSAIVTIAGERPNRAPTCNDTSRDIPSGIYAYHTNMWCSDDSPQEELRFSIVTPPPPHVGTVTINENTAWVTYLPAPGYSGTFTFTYRACDNDGTGLCSSPATVTYTVGGRGDSRGGDDSMPGDPNGPGVLGGGDLGEDLVGGIGDKGDKHYGKPEPPKSKHRGTKVKGVGLLGI